MITVFIPYDEKSTFTSFQEQFPDAISITDMENSFDGNSLLQIALEVTKITMATIAGILSAKLGKNNTIIIKDSDGREVTAQLDRPITLEELHDFLEKNIDED